MKNIKVILLFLIIPCFAFSQVIKDQLTGRVIDGDTNTGIEGVEIQLLNTNTIVYTDSDGKFKIENKEGFVVGEPNYSFIIQKDGFKLVSNPNNKVVFGSGSIENLMMRKDIDKFLWITVLDGRTGDFVEDVEVEIKGIIKKTNAFGKVSYDLSKFGLGKVNVNLSKDCFKDYREEIENKGEKYVNMTPTCTQDDMPLKGIDLNNAILSLDRALASRDGSIQGQIRAIEELIKNGYIYKNTNFDGVSLNGANLRDTDFSSCTFQTSNVEDVVFDHTDLTEADFNFSVFKNSSFKKTNAERVFFQFAQGENADFEGANLQRSSFFWSKLNNVNFRNANLRGVCLSYCDLTGADFTGADLTDAVIVSSVLDQAIFKDAIIMNTDVGNSVSEGDLNFTSAQIDELCKSTPIYKIDVNIWGNSLESEKWNSNYPFFNSYYTKIDNIPTKIKGSLKIRSKESLAPVGAFRHYSSDGRTTVGSNYWFEGKFWNHGERKFKVKAFLEKHAEYLFNKIAGGTRIEGSGKEIAQFYSFIEKQVKITKCQNPLIWNEESQNVMLLSKQYIAAEDIYWKSYASKRCAIDNNYTDKFHYDSWQAIYPKEISCSMLPSTHLDYYKAWTVDRAKDLKLKEIQINYSITLNDFDKLQEISNGNSSKQKLLIYKKVENHKNRLSGAMNPKKVPKDEPEKYLGFPKMYKKSIMKVPENIDQYYIEIDKEKLPKPKPGTYKLNTRIIFSIVYSLKDITKDENENIIFTTIPKKGMIRYEDAIYWEGKIENNN